MNVSIAEGGHILVALQMPRLFTPPHPHLQNISSNLHELRKWSLAARGGSSCSICSILATPQAADSQNSLSIKYKMANGVPLVVIQSQYLSHGLTHFADCQVGS